MSEIEIGPDQIQIDAEIVAKALKLTPQDLRDRMRDGTVTSSLEQGEGDDAGRVRLTFFSATRRARITADGSGTILSCSGADFRRPFDFLETPPPPGAAPDAQEHNKLDKMLDAALNQTFPASDPIALSFDRTKVRES